MDPQRSVLYNKGNILKIRTLLKLNFVFLFQNLALYLGLIQQTNQYTEASTLDVFNRGWGKIAFVMDKKYYREMKQFQLQMLITQPENKRSSERSEST